jgi:tetratricopeptide (TPR) repeat protein
MSPLHTSGPDQWRIHVPLGKLKAERMVPIDSFTRDLIHRLRFLRGLDPSPPELNILQSESINQAVLHAGRCGAANRQPDGGIMAGTTADSEEDSIMTLKPQDLQTYEAYKKAMRAAAGQVGNNTPFCLYSDVQMPDNSKKMHTLKPFLVVGATPSTIAPIWKTLAGSRTLVCAGLCSLQGGKISLVAKSGTLNYGMLKSQATAMKDLMGKEILIPPAGGAAPDAKPEAMDGIKTEFGLFTYFSKDPKFVSVVKDIVQVFGQASDDLDETNVAYKEMKDFWGKIPSRDEIKKWIEEGDPTGSSGNAARWTKDKYQSLERYRKGITYIQQDYEYTVESLTSAFTLLQGEVLGQAAKKLKKEVEEKKARIEADAGLIKIIIDGAEAMEKHPAELIKDAVDAIAKMVGHFVTKDLEKAAEEYEKQSDELKIDGLDKAIASAVKRLGTLSGRLDDAMKDLQDADKLVQAGAKAPMNIFDKVTKASKGKFKFHDLEMLAERAKESLALGKPVVGGVPSGLQQCRDAVRVRRFQAMAGP